MYRGGYGCGYNNFYAFLNENLPSTPKFHNCPRTLHVLWCCTLLDSRGAHWGHKPPLMFVFVVRCPLMSGWIVAPGTSPSTPARLRDGVWLPECLLGRCSRWSPKRHPLRCPRGRPLPLTRSQKRLRGKRRIATRLNLVSLHPFDRYDCELHLHDREKYLHTA